MKKSGLCLTDPWLITEESYDLNVEANIATLFTTGNGYMGLRGSLEEFGSVRIQGAYIRGVIDRIIEIPAAFADNVYMKKYYFNEEGLRHFEKQDCIVNFADPLAVRIKIDGETFYPWEGELLSWRRTLDTRHGVLQREVRWQNSKGQITHFLFERFASFADDHVYAQAVTVTPENYSAPIEILSGIDRTTKTNGQFVCLPIESEADGDTVQYTELSGEHFRFAISTACRSSLFVNDQPVSGWTAEDGEDILGSRICIDATQGVAYRLEKQTYIITSRDIPSLDPYAGSGDPDAPPEEERIKRTRLAAREGLDGLRGRYADRFASHLCAWQDAFAKLDVKIEGDDTADRSLRFSNYHTLITLARNDHVHSLAAKGLTGDIYNDFVWWDCEIYQAPVFYQTMPEAAKQTILYRYDKLPAARENARREGMPGARFPFTSSVTGEETVWAYARHPFLQIHIVADVAYGVLNYYQCTGDDELMLGQGMEILCEVCRWWAARVSEHDGRFEIRNVTGTDEHHPYIDNNAYTNYEVCFVLRQTAALCARFGSRLDALFAKIGLSPDEIGRWQDIADRLYLPMEPNGMIPQFDGYFGLSRTLEVVGKGSATSFQMKQSGLYHKSQVIKQPDVLLLFTYLGLEADEEVYSRNYDYYVQRCEASSSLTYPVHAIAAADIGMPDTAYDHFLKAARLDMDDEHDCAFQGLHTACAAGAWLAAVRGFGGTKLRADGVWLRPHIVPWWKCLSYTVVWHGQTLHMTVTGSNMTVVSDAENSADVPLFTPAGKAVLTPGGKHVFSTAVDTAVHIAPVIGGER